MTVTRTIELQDITPAELAELFTEMDGHEQGQFFAAILPIAAKWPGAGWCQQSCDIITNAKPEALSVIEILASHLPHDVLHRLAEAALEAPQ